MPTRVGGNGGGAVIGLYSGGLLAAGIAEEESYLMTKLLFCQDIC